MEMRNLLLAGLVMFVGVSVFTGAMMDLIKGNIKRAAIVIIVTVAALYLICGYIVGFDKML